MGDMPSRREELIAGALMRDLSDDEWREFDQARMADPSMDAELAELRVTAARLDAADVTWREETPSASLEERILAEISDADQDPDDTGGRGQQTPMFTGLSAFPHTPLRNDIFDEPAYAGLVERLAVAGVDSITALGSAGSYMYLDRQERARAAQAAVQHAGAVPVMVGIGALRTSQVHRLAEDAQNAGASAVLLAPVTYQGLSEDEVFGLFEDVTAGLSVPLVVYDNPSTTHVNFTDELYARIAALPQVASIKIPGVPAEPAAAATRVQEIREHIPDSVTIGVSGDDTAARGLTAGCDAWYSVIGGTLPTPALTITRAAQAGDHAGALAESARLDPLWALFAAHGSYRVTAAIAEHLDLVAADSLPRPVRGLGRSARVRVGQVLEELDLAQ